MRGFSLQMTLYRGRAETPKREIWLETDIGGS
jgi:hypothetical protein